MTSTRRSSRLRRAGAAFVGLLRRFRFPVRLRVTRGGGLFAAGAVAIGLAAINTGSNLLYLLVGGMMGFIAVSGWLSEQVIWGVEVEALPPRGITAGAPTRVPYEIRNRNKRAPIYAIVLKPPEGSPAFTPMVRPGHGVVVRAERTFPRRGVFPLEEVRVTTSFPFGLFVKERAVRVKGEVVVWPRRDRPVRDPMVGALGRRARAELGAGGAGARGEFRGLREYRPGDDPRDVHWRSTARLGEPLVREYEQDTAPATWLCLDLSAPPGERPEVAVELVASLAERAVARGERVALVTPDAEILPAPGRRQLERILDTLARATFRPGAGLPRPPAPRRSVLVTPGAPPDGFGAVITPETA
jgi:uncharacterized protein (DUF58 family)